MKFGFNLPSGFRGEDVLNVDVRRTTYDGRRRHAYTISSAVS